MRRSRKTRASCTCNSTSKNFNGLAIQNVKAPNERAQGARFYLIIAEKFALAREASVSRWPVNSPDMSHLHFRERTQHGKYGLMCFGCVTLMPASTWYFCAISENSQAHQIWLPAKFVQASYMLCFKVTHFHHNLQLPKKHFSRQSRPEMHNFLSPLRWLIIEK